MGQSPQASCSFATTVTYCKPEAAVSSVTACSTLEVSGSLWVLVCLYLLTVKKVFAFNSRCFMLTIIDSLLAVSLSIR